MDIPKNVSFEHPLDQCERIKTERLENGVTFNNELGDETRAKCECANTAILGSGSHLPKAYFVKKIWEMEERKIDLLQMMK